MAIETQWLRFTFDAEQIETKERGFLDSTYGGRLIPNSRQVDAAMNKIANVCAEGGWEVKSVTPLQGIVYWGASKTAEAREPLTTGIMVLLQRNAA